MLIKTLFGYILTNNSAFINMISLRKKKRKPFIGNVTQYEWDFGRGTFEQWQKSNDKI